MPFCLNIYYCYEETKDSVLKKMLKKRVPGLDFQELFPKNKKTFSQIKIKRNIDYNI